jgi:hypothetical protein
MMNHTARFVVAAAFTLLLIAAVSAIPPVTHVTSGFPQATAQTLSASGMISAVDKESFTITVPPIQKVGATSVSQQDTPKSMTFVVDKNTTIEGKLQVGANADVTYRDDNGNHVAIGVRVTPPRP